MKSTAWGRTPVVPLSFFNIACLQMTFAKKVLKFYKTVEIGCDLPDGVGVMNPYANAACIEVCKNFYARYYDDDRKRFLILGINPGRYGAGITGIPFTDPIKLESIF